jgi:hypothetical protein
MNDPHKQKAITIYNKALLDHRELVVNGVNANGTDTWKGSLFDADKIAQELIAPQIKVGDKDFIVKKWKQRMDEYEAMRGKTPLKDRTYEMALFNRTKNCTRRWYSDTMVRRAIQLEIEIN